MALAVLLCASICGCVANQPWRLERYSEQCANGSGVACSQRLGKAFLSDEELIEEQARIDPSLANIAPQEVINAIFRKTEEPFFNFAASNNCTAAGGVLITKSKDLSL